MAMLEFRQYHSSEPDAKKNRPIPCWSEQGDMIWPDYVQWQTASDQQSKGRVLMNLAKSDDNDRPEHSSTQFATFVGNPTTLPRSFTGNADNLDFQYTSGSLLFRLYNANYYG